MSLFIPLQPISNAEDKSHHVGDPPTHYRNPWPSFPATHASFTSILKTRFGSRPPFIPVPDRPELVQIYDPDFSIPAQTTGFRITWIGHASFLIQVLHIEYARPLGILLDPVFSERTSPVTFFGPKRYTSTPCTISALLESVPIDVVCISHNHYDHADVTTLKTIFDYRQGQGENVLFCVARGNPRWLTSLGIPPEHIWEADWWERIEVPSSSSTTTGKSPSLRITCTPSQHASRRGVLDQNSDLWCSWSIQLSEFQAPYRNDVTTDATTDNQSRMQSTKSLFFAGDTGYRTIPQDPPSDISSIPVCPAFKQIGQNLGPFDLALLPIGLNRPREFMSAVHANASDSICIHRDINAKRSIGMHWGTVRGGLSQYYEDVRDPPREWKEEALKAGLTFRDRISQRCAERDNEPGTNRSNGAEAQLAWDIGLLDIGESLVV